MSPHWRGWFALGVLRFGLNPELFWQCRFWNGGRCARLWRRTSCRRTVARLKP